MDAVAERRSGRSLRARVESVRISGGGGPVAAVPVPRHQPRLLATWVNTILKNEEKSASHSLIAYAECFSHIIQVLLMGASGSGKTSMRSLILCVPLLAGPGHESCAVERV